MRSLFRIPRKVLCFCLLCIHYFSEEALDRLGAVEIEPDEFWSVESTAKYTEDELVVMVTLDSPKTKREWIEIKSRLEGYVADRVLAAIDSEIKQSQK